MVRPRAPLRILLALGWYDYRLQRGIERYAQAHGWSMRMDLIRSRIIPWGWDGDGILAWLGADDELAEFVVQVGKPTVDFSLRRPHLRFTRVLEDTAEAANLAAEHLGNCGVRNFMFYSDRENWVYDERGRHFVRQLRESGRKVCWLRWHESPDFGRTNGSWKIKRQWLKNAIHKSKKPVGVFAASDELALEVLDACELAGIHVPDDVAIIGAGDSLLAVESMRTPISSVDTNLELLGYCGAQELDRLLHERSKPSPIRTIRIPPAGVIARKSSDLLAVRHPGVARSMRHILENYHEPLSVRPLARVASMSKGAFHRAFSACIGRGPGEEIRRVRAERAKELLRESSAKLSVIAGECGYKNSNTFSIAFKKATGLSPRDYRAKCVIPALRT